jgi:hypothetical protein
MVIVAEINDRPEVEGGALVWKVGLIKGLVINLQTDGHIFADLFLQEGACVTPVVVTGQRIDSVTAASIGCPRTPALLQPERHKHLRVPVSQIVPFTSGRHFH